MILIKGISQFGKVERLIEGFTDQLHEWIEAQERAGFVMSFTMLPAHIQTHEQHAAILLDEFAEMYLPETEKLN